MPTESPFIQDVLKSIVIVLLEYGIQDHLINQHTLPMGVLKFPYE